MQSHTEPMKLTGKELKLLSLLARHGKASVSEVVAELRELPPQMSRVIAGLQEKDFVRTERAGVSKILSLSETKHSALWRKLGLEFEHIPFDELLSGVSLEVLSAICFLNLRNRKEIAKHCLVSEASVARTLERLKQVGIVEKAEPGYRVSTRFQTLKELVIEYRHYLNQRIAKRFADDALVHWECNNEFILETRRREEGDGFHLTASSVFARFGVTLLSTKSYFFYSPFRRKLRLEDAVLHSLQLRNVSPLPVLLVWKNNQTRLDMSYLRNAGEKYGAGQLIDRIVAYFESRGGERPRGLPPWDEFMRRAKEYPAKVSPEAVSYHARGLSSR